MEALIFDMDGVIIDSQPMHYKVDSQILKECGIDKGREYLLRFTGKRNSDMWKEVKETFNIEYSVEDLINMQNSRKIKCVKRSHLKPIDGIIELMDEAKKNGIVTAIASSSPVEMINTVIEKFKLKDKIDFCISGEEIENGKPAPDIYLKAAKVLNVKPEKCVVIEDSMHGSVAAKRAGMKCIGFRNLNSGVQDLHNADIIVDSIREIRIDQLIK